jgi:hypothetical protein
VSTLVARPLAHERILVAAGLVLLWVGVSAALALWFSGRIRDWSVMTDELLYAKLATAIGESGSPLPEVHDTRVSVLNQLYPLLIAPFYGTLSPPSAFRAAHVLNAVVMTSAVFPAYLLARQVVPRAWSFAVAGLSVVVPWIVLTGFLMTEVAAYPAFLWAMLGLQLAIAAPSARGDLLAAGALVLAVLARTQFAVLVLVLPLAIVGHEVGWALASSAVRGLRKALESGREAVRRHQLLAVLYGAGLLFAAAVAVLGSVGSLLGTYAVTVEEGSILPSGVWAAAVRHLDAVAIGCGLVPLILGGAWMLSTVVRPRNAREHAVATLLLVTVVLVTIEAASYGVRFGGGEVVRDRYLFYVVPLLLVGSAAALSGVSRRAVTIGAAVLTLFFAATVHLLPFTTFEGLSVDWPTSVLNDVLIEQSAGLGTGTFVALVGLLSGFVLVLGLLLAPRTPLALAVFSALFLFSALTLRSEVDRVLTGTGLSGRPLAEPSGLVLDWVDTVVPTGAEAAIVPFPVSTAWDTSAIRWWDVEFWNRRITRTYVAPDGNFSYTNFPRDTLVFDRLTGEVAGTSDAPLYVVAAPQDPRFLLAGRKHAENVGLVVQEVDRPYRAVWTTEGLQTDGWTLPRKEATIRIYARSDDRAELTAVQLTLRAPENAPSRYRISWPSGARAGRLSAAAERGEALTACVPAGSAVDVTLTGWSRARIEGPQLSPDIGATRRVGVLPLVTSVRPTGRPCRPVSG